MSPPAWLPPLLPLDGAQADVILRLYQVFSNDFKRTGCTLCGAPVRWDGRVLPAELYEEGFWHVISRDRGGVGGRGFNRCRAARLSWCKAVIEHADDQDVTAWEDRVNG